MGEGHHVTWSPGPVRLWITKKTVLKTACVPSWLFTISGQSQAPVTSGTWVVGLSPVWFGSRTYPHLAPDLASLPFLVSLSSYLPASPPLSPAHYFINLTRIY